MLERAGDIPVAFLALLELREVFDVDDAEVAKALGKALGNALGNALGKALAGAARIAPRDVAVWLRGERERLACQRLALAQRTTGELLSQQAVRYPKRFSKYFG